MDNINLYNGDCLEVMKSIPDKSVDMILCDLPYGTTDNPWDSVIPFEPLWEQYKRVLIDSGVVVLFGSQPFTTSIINSNLEMFRYEWIWEKESGTGFLNAKKAPLKNHENICVFYLDKAEVTGRSKKFNELRNYFEEEKKKSGLSNKDIQALLGNQMYRHYFSAGTQFSIPTRKNYEKLQSTGFFKTPYDEIKAKWDKLSQDCRFTYNPQFSEGKPYVSNGSGNSSNWGNIKPKEYKSINTGYRYPKSILKFNRDKEKLHPTQKPVALLEYLIKTYTNENELVLDNCMGSGSTGIACINTNRKFIGIELDNNYFNIAKDRINKRIQHDLH